MIGELQESLPAGASTGTPGSTWGSGAWARPVGYLSPVLRNRRGRMKTAVSRRCVGARVSALSRVTSVRCARPVSLALGLAVLLLMLGAFLMPSQPSRAQVAVGAPKSPAAGNQPQDTPSTTPTCPATWNVVPSPNTGGNIGSIEGIAAVSA